MFYQGTGPPASPIHRSIRHPISESVANFVFKTVGTLILQDPLIIQKANGESAVPIKSKNGGFRIIDCRSESTWVISRNGSTLFFYETFENERKCPINVVRPPRRFSRWDKKHDIRVVDDELDIVSFRRA